MPGPFLRIDLSPDAVDFRPVMVQAGLPLLERWAERGGVLRDWLGRFAAEPIWEGDTVGYYVTDDQGGRLVDMVCQPASPADLRGRLQGELAALRDRLRQAAPKSASGQAIHQYLCRQLLERAPEDLKYQWFKYRDPSGAWQLVWCGGYGPISERLLARPVICGNPQCRQLTLVNPRERVTCGRCGASVPPRSSRVGRLAALAVVLLLFVGAALGSLWWLRPVVDGQVIRALDGQPIPAARVRIVGAERDIVADAGGAFRQDLFLALPGKVTLQVAASGFRDQQIEAELKLGRETRIEVPLEGAGQLLGQVVCLIGTERVPVANASAQIVGVQLAAAQTDAEGAFRWDVLPPGPLELQVSAPGYVNHSAQFDVSTPSSSLEVVLTGDRTVEGRVVYAADNSRPVEGAEVRWAGSETPVSSTDESGYFSLSGLPPLPIKVQATAPGFRTQMLSVPPDAPPPTIPLTGDAVLRGLVLRGDTDQPAAKAEVTIVGTPWRAVTDEEGQFRCAEVRSGPVTLLATVPGMSASIPAELAPSDETEVRIVLTGGAVLRGRVVVSGTEQPVAQATVSIPDTRLSASTDNDGHFVLTGMPAAEVPLRVSADGFVSRDLSYELSDGEQTIEQIALTALVDVHGVVVRAVDGEPVAGATVAIAAPRVTDQSGQDGQFRLPGVPHAPVRLGVLADGYARQVLSLEPDGQPVRIELVGEAALRGRIINEVDSQPIAGAAIAVDDSPWKTTTDEAGGFALDGVVAGPATLHLAASGFASRSLESKLAADNQDLGDITLTPLASADASTVRFFGIETQARSIGFVVDCSGSMGHGRMEGAKAELIESVLQLTPAQRFYVTFFSDREFPMSEPPRDLIPASLPEKTRLFQWMGGIQAAGGTNPEPGLVLTAEMKPEAIFLLSDGVFEPLRPSTFELLAAEQIVVHTIAFEDPSGAATLQQIAEQTGGTYRFIPAGTSPQEFELTMVDWLTRNLTQQPPADVRVFHETLCELSGGQDFGPPENAPHEERVACADRWNQWWREHLAERRQAEAAEQMRLEEIARKEREAEAAERTRLEALSTQEREAEAAEQRRKYQYVASVEELRLARLLQEQYVKTNRWNDPDFRERVIRRLQHIVKDFPETEAAKEARQLLQQWQ